MNVRELIAFLNTCDPEAVVLPGTGRMSGYVPAFAIVRASVALEKTTANLSAPVKTKYLESPKSGNTKVVVLE